MFVKSVKVLPKIIVFDNHDFVLHNVEKHCKFEENIII